MKLLHFADLHLDTPFRWAPAQTADDVQNWANRWHALSSHPFPSEEYNAALEAITRSFTDRGATLVGGQKGVLIGPQRMPPHVVVTAVEVHVLGLWRRWRRQRNYRRHRRRRYDHRSAHRRCRWQ